MELEVATMVKTLTEPESGLGSNPEIEPLARECSPPFYSRLGPLPPKHLGGKGCHIPTKEEARCTIKAKSTIKVESMDAVHGRGAASPKLKRGTAQPGRWAGAADVERVPR